MSELEPLSSIIRRTEATYGINSVDAQPRECETCGTVPPYRLPSGRLIRGTCDCEREARRLLIMRQQHQAWTANQTLDTYGWLGKDFTDLSYVDKLFETFQPERQQKAYNAAREFALDPVGNFVLYGDYGTGKTHLLAAICNELRCREVASRFCKASKLFHAMQQAIGHHEDSYILMRKAIGTPLLVFDDADKANPSEWRNEMILEIFDERATHGRPIALSTNKLTELARYIGGAACSRLSIGQIAVEMTGADFRMEM